MLVKAAEGEGQAFAWLDTGSDGVYLKALIIF